MRALSSTCTMPRPALVSALVALLAACTLVSAQRSGDAAGPAKSNPRMLHGELFRPGKASGAAYYGLLTAYGGPWDGVNRDQPSYGVKEGGCGYGVMDRTQWPFWNAIALRHQDSPLLNSITRQRLGCGMCVQVQCVDATNCKSRDPVNLVITDICPTCENSGHVDGHVLWVEKMLSVNRAIVKVQRVDCIPPKGRGIDVVIMDYNGPMIWLRMRIEKVAGPGVLTRVRVQDDGMAASNQWMTMENRWGAVWEVNNSPRRSRLRFELTADDGQVRVTDFISLQPGAKSLRVPMNHVQFDFQTLKGINYGDPPAWNTRCQDIPADQNSCAQQKSWGKCNLPFMLATTASQWGYCAQTCGRCPATGRRLHEYNNATMDPLDAAPGFTNKTLTAPGGWAHDLVSKFEDIQVQQDGEDWSVVGRASDIFASLFGSSSIFQKELPFDTTDELPFQL